MRDFGLSLFGRSLNDATFSELSKPYTHAVAVVTAAHAGEILLKARIAEEHPLLIFKSLPTSSTTDSFLDLEALIKSGQSYGYDQLPELLWASTGIRVEHLETYREFGKLRNSITHFAVPNVDLPAQTLQYCIQVIYPLVRRFWDVLPLRYAEDWYEDIVDEGYLEYSLVRNSVPISAELRAELGEESRVRSEQMIQDVKRFEKD